LTQTTVSQSLAPKCSSNLPSFAISGVVRQRGESDAALNHLTAKKN